MSSVKHTLNSGLRLGRGTTLLAVLLIASPAAAVAAPHDQAPAQAAPEIATDQFGGTTLTVTPNIGYYERAVLRVSGPRHYALTKRFETNAPISADLVSEGQQSIDGEENSEASNALPHGRYRYEVVFHTGSAQPKAHTGTFQYP